MTLDMSADAPADVDATLQAVAALPPNLQENILRRIPLPYALHHFPATFHPTILRAHHPSIATHDFLHLHPVPVDLMPAALHATATLSHLLCLSLAGATLPRPPSRSIRLIKPLSGITSLSLRGTGISADAATAVAGALPCFPALRSLDLSGNRIELDAMRELAAAITLHPTLQSLDMSCTLCKASPGISDSLAVAVCALRSLTSFRVGPWQPHGDQLQGQDNFTGEAQHALWSAVRGLPELAVLQVDFELRASPVEVFADAAAGVATLTRLEHLRLVVQVCTDLPDSQEHAAVAEAGSPARAQQSVLAASMHSMQQLALVTSVDLELSSTTVHSADELSKLQAGAAKLLSSVSNLLLLQRLCCCFPIWNDHADADPPCSELARALPRLVELTQLQLRDRHAIEPGLASVAAVVWAAVQLPQLRVLHVPVSAVQGGGQLVTTLLDATHISHLTLDLFMNTMGAGSAALWPYSLDVFVPLFPRIAELTVWALGSTELLWPILSHVTALKQLRKLTIDALSFEWWSAIQRDQAQSMGGLRCLSQLNRLTGLHLGMSSLFDPLDTQSLALAVAGMPMLEHLTWDVMSLGQRVLIPDELLGAFLQMPGLKVVNMGVFRACQADMCMKVLPQLLLVELQVKIHHTRDLQALVGVVQGLRRLRCLVVRQSDITDVQESALRGATAVLPSFEQLYIQT